MPLFREESVFIAENWETVQDIIAATKRLEEDLFAVLESLEVDLRNREWWEEKWQFHRSPPSSEVWITTGDWPWRKEYAVTIGVENFTGESVLGDADPPQLYVWCPTKLTALVEELVARLNEEDLPMGIAGYEVSSGYVVTDLLPEYTEGSLEEYGEIIRERTLAFMDYYAPQMMTYDELIKHVIAQNLAAGD